MYGTTNSSAGTNYYTLVEIDEGDNDEEKQITYINHNFTFSSQNGESVTWDFGDGYLAIGEMVSHEYEFAGVYSVTATSIRSDKVQSQIITITVHLAGIAEVDNMECECAPTAKDTNSSKDIVREQHLRSRNQWVGFSSVSRP